MDCLEHCASCLDQIAHHPLGKLAVQEADGIPGKRNQNLIIAFKKKTA